MDNILTSRMLTIRAASKYTLTHTHSLKCLTGTENTGVCHSVGYHTQECFGLTHTPNAKASIPWNITDTNGNNFRSEN